MPPFFISGVAGMARSYGNRTGRGPLQEWERAMPATNPIPGPLQACYGLTLP